MSRNCFVTCRAAGLCAVLLLAVSALCLGAATTAYVQVNLVSDVAGVALKTDPNLKNPWGVSFAATSPFWVSNQGSSKATLYDGQGTAKSLVVSIPTVGIPSGPTGQVFNATTSFNLSDNKPAVFIFDTLDGQIVAWNGDQGTTAVNVQGVPGAIFTGLAIGSVGNANYLYAADNTGHIYVFDGSFNNVTNTTFSGKFIDPNGMAGFNPFNIQNIGGALYVTYAMVNGQGVGQPGGFVDAYDTSGNLLLRIATGGQLYAPWGITQAPTTFGSLGGDLLIGQFGNGEILAYDPTNNYAFVSTLNGTGGAPIVNPYLWALEFRSSGPNINANQLYFTAGYNNQQDGLFGFIEPPNQLVSIPACRLVDTRMASGGSGPIQGGKSATFNLPQLAMMQGCPELSLATAYSLNVTAVPQRTLSFLTVFPTGDNQPVTSTLNSPDGRTKANAAIVSAGANQSVNVFVTDSSDVVIDIDAYFAPSNATTLAFFPVPPCRVADTRDNTFPQGLGPPSLSGGMPRDLPIMASNCGIPASAQAYSVNLTVVPQVPLGYLTVWPTGQPQPGTSTLNAPTGTTTANAAIVQAGTGGDIDVFPTNDTDLVVDINGYFAPSGPGGLSLYPLAPCRVSDTRAGSGAFSGVMTVNVQSTVCAPPGPAQAYILNATVVPSGPLGYLTMFDGGSQPGTSTLNAVDGLTTSNMAIVSNSNGTTDAFATSLTDLVLDISGYFAP